MNNHVMEEVERVKQEEQCMGEVDNEVEEGMGEDGDRIGEVVGEEEGRVSDEGRRVRVVEERLWRGVLCITIDEEGAFALM